MFVRSVLFLCLWLVTCGNAFGTESSSEAGYVSALRGEVYAISSDGVTRNLKLKDPISIDDYIVTENKGRVKIVFQDNTIITLGPKSRIKLNDYYWKKDIQKGKFNITITEGLFRIIGGKITKSSPQSFIAKTPAASIGIRGSSYAGRVSGKKLKVFLESGKGIDVTNNKGSVALLSPGMGTTVTNAEDSPAEPRRFSSSEIYDILSGSAVDNSSGGSTICSNATIINQATITNSVNIAIGKNNSAQMGSIRIKDSEVNGTVVNQAEISDSANISSGSNNSATMGSIDAE